MTDILESRDISEIDGAAFDTGMNIHVLFTIEADGVFVLDLYNGAIQVPELVGDKDNHLGSIKVNAPDGTVTVGWAKD